MHHAVVGAGILRFEQIQQLDQSKVLCHPIQINEVAAGPAAGDGIDLQAFMG